MRRATHNPASQTNLLGISIHALLAESDRISEDVSYSIIVFLSTLSLRRATSRAKTTDMAKRHFYPRSPCGERPPRRNANCNCRSISIHALLAESDEQNNLADFAFFQFLSTLSLRRATLPETIYTLAAYISIHALLAESDAPRVLNYRPKANFYPRSPCGERLCWMTAALPPPRFLSTLSLRRATWYQQAAYSFLTDISIHALLAESDILGRVGVASRTSFLSTLSLRRATPRRNANCSCRNISIHALLAESDKSNKLAERKLVISIHALLAESD